jgi:hypothetical protein
VIKPLPVLLSACRTTAANRRLNPSTGGSPDADFADTIATTRRLVARFQAWSFELDVFTAP